MHAAITFDDANNMWHAEIQDKTGVYHRRWFHTYAAAQKWIASKKGN